MKIKSFSKKVCLVRGRGSVKPAYWFLYYTGGATMGLTMTDTQGTLAVLWYPYCYAVNWSGVLSLWLWVTAVMGIVGHTWVGLSWLLSIDIHSSGK